MFKLSAPHCELANTHPKSWVYRTMAQIICRSHSLLSATVQLFHPPSIASDASLPSQLISPSVSGLPWVQEPLLHSSSPGAQILSCLLSFLFPFFLYAWFPLQLTGLISLESNWLSRIFSSTIVQKHQFFSTQSSFWFNSYFCTWLLEKP